MSTLETPGTLETPDTLGRPRPARPSASAPTFRAPTFRAPTFRATRQRDALRLRLARLVPFGGWAFGLREALAVTTIAAATIAGACSAPSPPDETAAPNETEAGSDAAVATAGEPRPPVRAPVPASRHLMGRFEYRTELHGEPLRLGWSFDDERVMRWTHDTITATERYRIVDETEDTITVVFLPDSPEIDPTVDVTPLATHRFRFADPDTLVHGAVESVAYRRVP